MSKSKDYLLHRAGWYLAGFVLFFAPLALFPRLLLWLLPIQARNADIHAACLRMPIGGLLNGRVAPHGFLSVSFITFSLLVLSAFLLGPVFCGRLCAAGAFPEYLGRLIPDKWKINWQKLVNPTPVRYGFFAAFLVAPLLAGSLTCGFCSFSFMQKLINTSLGARLGVLGSTTILTVFLWLILLGIAARGGRGFCSFLCPIGALQNLLYSLGSRFNFTWKLRYDRNKCTSCHTCVKECPMGALQPAEEGGVEYKQLNCLTCRQCEAVCAKKAITYGRGESGWKSKSPRTGWFSRKTVVTGILLLILAGVIPTVALGASENTYEFNKAMDQLIEKVNHMDTGFLTKISLRIKLTQVLTYSHQLYPDRTMDPKEIAGVVRESLKMGNTVDRTVSTTYAVDLARKMDLTSQQVVIIRRTMLTGEGNLKQEGIPLLYLDTLNSYGAIEKPPCCAGN